MFYTIYRIFKFGVTFHKWRTYVSWANIPYRTYLNGSLCKPYDTTYGCITIRGAHE